jgi:hypothetical protein
MAQAIDNWEFYQHPDGGWSWRNVPPGRRGGHNHFSNIVDAIADAARNGFRLGTSKIAAFKMCRRAQMR